jgi:SAM-dependent methyltransferase
MNRWTNCARKRAGLALIDPVDVGQDYRILQDVDQKSPVNLFNPEILSAATSSLKATLPSLALYVNISSQRLMTLSMQEQAAETLREWRATAPFWKKHAGTIRIMFAPVTEALIEEASIGPGQSVVDVAGGAGEPSLTIAARVGPTGSVAFTDVAEEMVNAARSEALRRQVTNIKFYQSPADSLPFEDNLFDAAVSRLGVMFFPDPLAGLKEMLRVDKPDGVVSLVVWGIADENPFSYEVTRVLARYVEPAPPDAGAPDAFRFGASGVLSELVAQAGAANVRERLFKFQIQAPISLEEFWVLRSETSGTLRQKLATMAEEQRRAIREEVIEAVEPYFADNQMDFPAEMLIVTGNKSS